MPDPLRRLAESKSLPGPLWRADAVFAAAFCGRGAEKSRITLRRWDARTGIALPDVVLSEEGHTIRYPSADGRHLLVSRRTGSDPDYEWVIFSLETGQRAATLHHPSPGARFFLADGLLVHEVRPASGLVEGRAIEEPLALRAVDLASGRERWKRPLRDTAYRGPYPPHPSEPSGTRSSAHLRKEELCAMPAEKFR